MQLPDRRTSWIALIPGSVLFGLAITVLRTVSRLYLPYHFERSSRAYGSVRVATVMLAWLLVIRQVIGSPALINAAWAQHRALPAEEATRIKAGPRSERGHGDGHQKQGRG